MSTPNLKEREDFIFNPTLSDIALDPKSDDDLSKEIFKTFKQEDIIDAYEKSMGIKQRTYDIPKTRYKHIMLSPGTSEDDSELLDQLKNDPELFQIIGEKSTWTVRGEYKIFIEYLENLDVKKAREAAKKDKSDE